MNFHLHCGYDKKSCKCYIDSLLDTICVILYEKYPISFCYYLQCRDRYLNMIIPREEGKIPLVRIISLVINKHFLTSDLRNTAFI